MNGLASDPRFAAKVPSAPLSPDAAYIRMVLPTPGDMRAGQFVDDNDTLPLKESGSGALWSDLLGWSSGGALWCDLLGWSDLIEGIKYR